MWPAVMSWLFGALGCIPLRIGAILDRLFFLCIFDTAESCTAAVCNEHMHENRRQARQPLPPPVTGWTCSRRC